MSIRAAAAKFDIPYPTLRKHIIKGSATKLLDRFRQTWSSYCAWPLSFSQHSLFMDQSSTGFSRSSWIACRLSASPVTCQPSLLSPAACLKAAFWDSSSLLYAADVTNIALRCGLNVHSYDTHLYAHCDAVNCAAEAARLAACIEELDGWALSYFSPHMGQPCWV